MVTSFTDTFGGSPVSPAEVAFAAYSFSVDTPLYWPNFSSGQTNVAARFMNITATTTGVDVSMPDASLVSVGYDVIIFNAGAQTFNIIGYTGGAIATIAPGQTYYILLNDNTTIAGVWQTVQFGVGTGSASAAALAGAGLLAISSLLNVNFTAATVSNSYTITTANRAILQVWTGGTGVITLPAAASVGNGFFFPLANNGSGAVTVTAAGAEKIDGAATSVFSQTQSGFIISSGTGWYTVGKGLQNTFSVTLLNLNVAGASDITETSAQAQNIIQQYTGILTGNINIIMPNTVQLYYIFNNTSGAFSLTVKTAAGTGIAVVQGTHTILYCDGTNIVNGYTASVATSVSLSPGSANAPQLNFIGSPSTGIYSPSTNQFAITAGGFEVMNFISSASAVNYFQATASATTSPMILAALGTDANISINYTAKGTGSHNFLANGGATQFYIGNVSSAVNQLNVSGAATGNSPVLAASGSNTDINIVLTPKGAGTVVSGTFTGNLVGNVTGNVSGNAGTVTTINGRITAGTNVSITGAGTAGSPYSISATNSGGTVTSVAMTGDNIIFNTAVTGSPVTTTGTLIPVLKTQTANTFLSGPTTGGAVAPTFRALVAADIPTGIIALTSLATQAANTILANATAGSASPTAVSMGTDTVLIRAAANITTVALSASNLLGKGSTGNIAPITIGTGLSLTGTVLSATSIPPTQQIFTSSGTWTKPANCKEVEVTLVGGGGGARYSGSGGSAGGTTSFGALCSATGGSQAVPVSAKQTSGAGGGSGSSGDVNSAGQSGDSSYSAAASEGIAGAGGYGYLGYGSGGIGQFNNGSGFVTGGAGAGGYCNKLIDVTAISSVSITIGAGGTAGTSGAAGGSGIVIVKEYY